MQDKPIASDAILTDEQLDRGGLVKVEAFMRTRTSAAAARKSKQRERQAEEGLKTITIVAPAAANEPLKAIAKACAAGQSIEKAIIRAVPSVTSHGQVTIDPLKEHYETVGRKIDSLTGWRKIIVKWILR